MGRFQYSGSKEGGAKSKVTKQYLVPVFMHLLVGLL